MVNTETLGDYVRRERERRGMTLTALAASAELSKSELSALERGKIALPGADKRRRLARALGVSHLDLLVAAGEITDAEVRDAGVSPIPRLDPRRQRIVEKLAAIPPLDAYLTSLENVLDAFVKYGVQSGEPINQKPDELNDTGIGV